MTYTTRFLVGSPSGMRDIPGTEEQSDREFALFRHLEVEDLARKNGGAYLLVISAPEGFFANDQSPLQSPQAG